MKDKRQYEDLDDDRTLKLITLAESSLRIGFHSLFGRVCYGALMAALLFNFLIE